MTPWGLFGLIIWFYRSLGPVWVEKIRFYDFLEVVWIENGLWPLGVVWIKKSGFMVP